jgi:hypothetical protein
VRISTLRAHGRRHADRMEQPIMRRLRLPAAVAVTVVGVVAPLAAAFSACSGDDPTHPDARISSHADARAPDAGSDAGIADAAVPDATMPDAAVPVDAAPDTPIT